MQISENGLRPVSRERSLGRPVLRERSLGIWLLENKTEENKAMGTDIAALKKVTVAEIISPRKAVLRDQVEVAMLAAGGIQQRRAMPRQTREAEDQTPKHNRR